MKNKNKGEKRIKFSSNVKCNCTYCGKQINEKELKFLLITFALTGPDLEPFGIAPWLFREASPLCKKMPYKYEGTKMRGTPKMVQHTKVLQINQTKIL